MKLTKQFAATAGFDAEFPAEVFLLEDDGVSYSALLNDGYKSALESWKTYFTRSFEPHIKSGQLLRPIASGAYTQGQVEDYTDETKAQYSELLKTLARRGRVRTTFIPFK